MKEKPATRRGLLATLSSIYDPLSLASPYLLKGKRILQQLCGMDISRDEMEVAVIRSGSDQHFEMLQTKGFWCS